MPNIPLHIAVIGSGAIGGTVAAWLAQSPAHRVTLCVRTPLNDLQVDTPGGRITARPQVLTDPAQATPVDWVLTTTKTYDTAGAARWIDALAGPATRVAVLQNGVEHRDRFPAVSADRLVPVIVDIPAERDAPGRIRQRRTGTLTVADDAAGRAFAALFAATPITTVLTDDFATAAWAKLAINCAGAVNALTLLPAGIAQDPAVAGVMRALVAECLAVGRAEGANLPDTLPDDVVAGTVAGPADGINSIHADRAAGRPTEADARNGVIARLGARHGIATPLNAMAAALLATRAP
ncbi:2-dehydropantoate 2-reductase [Sphingomonas montana]|uniref:2-dehydropantoate 2-reductase n=1 Tax=Sphingomonas montana TaxID=1843236 RepID=UPI00096DF199|nr:2-dehydropantoate 2-reductase [Sphingomonas montana]